MELSDQLKMATRMGMRAGLEIAVISLEASIADPRSRQTTTIAVTLQAAVNAIRKQIVEQFPEDRA